MKGYLLGIALGVAVLATVARPIGRYAVGALSFRVAMAAEIGAFRHKDDWDSGAWWWTAHRVVDVNNRINGP